MRRCWDRRKMGSFLHFTGTRQHLPRAQNLLPLFLLCLAHSYSPFPFPAPEHPPWALDSCAKGSQPWRMAERAR